MSTETQKVPVMIYTEATPNPATLKFVLNRPLFPNDYYEFENINDTENAPLAKALFEIDGVIGVFISNNFVTISKNEDWMWVELMPSIKEFLKNYLGDEQPVFTEDFKKTNRKATNEIGADDSDVEVKIKGVLEQYVKPAVEMDGGAISFVSFEEGVLTLALQGSCSGCPSSTVTLKDGIENLMKRMVPQVQSVVAMND
ncbi:MAG: NifU family protein [Bacteroidetes bacterium]|nr:NifU family protein [Bacteroidota bacterium]